MYYIYHIPTFVQPDGSIGKIGCTSQQVKDRVNNQGYTNYEILETHSCIYTASDREIVLQKEYGYPVDTILYWKVYKMSRLLINENPNRMSDIGKLGMKKIQELGYHKKGGRVAGPIGGKIAVDSGQIYELHKFNCVKILVYDRLGNFINEYDSLKSAAKDLSLRSNHISRVLSGELKHTKGYVIKRKEE